MKFHLIQPAWLPPPRILQGWRARNRTVPSAISMSEAVSGWARVRYASYPTTSTTPGRGLRDPTAPACSGLFVGLHSNACGWRPSATSCHPQPRPARKEIALDHMWARLQHRLHPGLPPPGRLLRLFGATATTPGWPRPGTEGHRHDTGRSSRSVQIVKKADQPHLLHKEVWSFSARGGWRAPASRFGQGQTSRASSGRIGGVLAPSSASQTPSVPLYVLPAHVDGRHLDDVAEEAGLDKRRRVDAMPDLDDDARTRPPLARRRRPGGRRASSGGTTSTSLVGSGWSRPSSQSGRLLEDLPLSCLSSRALQLRRRRLRPRTEGRSRPSGAVARVKPMLSRPPHVVEGGDLLRRPDGVGGQSSEVDTRMRSNAGDEENEHAGAVGDSKPRPGVSVVGLLA